MARLKDLKLGQELYIPNIYKETITRCIITGLIKVRDDERIYVDGLTDCYLVDSLKKTIFFTNDKAQKYLDIFINKRIKEKKVREKMNSIEDKFLAENPKPISVGESVMIFEDGEWYKTAVSDVYTTWYKGRKPKWRWVIETTFGNKYTLKTIGKNWRFYNSLDDLKLRKKDLEIEINGLKLQQKELEFQIAELEKAND